MSFKVLTGSDIQASGQGPRPPYHSQGADTRETTLSRNEYTLPQGNSAGATLAQPCPGTLRGQPSAAAKHAPREHRGKPFCGFQNCPRHHLHLPKGDLLDLCSKSQAQVWQGTLKNFQWAPGAPLDFRPHENDSGQPVFCLTNGLEAKVGLGPGYASAWWACVPD